MLNKFDLQSLGHRLHCKKKGQLLAVLQKSRLPHNYVVLQLMPTASKQIPNSEKERFRNINSCKLLLLMCTNKQIGLCLGEDLSIESSAPSWWQIKSMWIIFLLPLHILLISCNTEQPNLQESPFFQLVAPFLCPLLHLFLLLTLPPQYPLFLLPTSNGYPWRWSPSSCPIFRMAGRLL